MKTGGVRIKEEEKYCEFCGKKLERKRFSSKLEDFGVFKKRKYCNRECMRMAFLKIGSFNQKYRTAHQTAVNIFKMIQPEKKCSICGKIGKLDIHHKDHNYQNNSLENLQYLCRSCHNKEHRKKKFCTVCGEPMKGYGFCNKHYLRYKKYGDPLYTKNKVRGI